MINQDLFTHAYQGSLEEVKNDLEKGACPNSLEEGEFKRTPLFAAVINKHVDVVEFLLAKGANSNQEDVKLRTPLIYAARESEDDRLIEIVGCLIKYHANLDVCDYYKHTPLFYAAGRNNIEMVKLLLHNGADLNFQNSDGETVLMHACRNTSNPDLIKVLLQYNADINAIDKQGFKAFSYLLKNPNLGAAKREIFALLGKTIINLNRFFKPALSPYENSNLVRCNLTKAVIQPKDDVVLGLDGRIYLRKELQEGKCFPNSDISIPNPDSLGPPEILNDFLAKGSPYFS